MKVMTILGTRPEIIRLSLVIKLLDRCADHILVHTGQNYDARLSGIFFRELGVRQPDVFLEVDSSSFGVQVGQILLRFQQELTNNFIHDGLKARAETRGADSSRSAFIFSARDR